MHHDIHISYAEKSIEPENTIVDIGDTIQFHSGDEGCRIIFHDGKSPIGIEVEDIPAGGSGEVHEIGDIEGAYEFSAEFSDLLLNSMVIVDSEGDEEEFESFEGEGFEGEGEDEGGSIDLSEAVGQIAERVLDTIESAAAVRAGFFFPHGIDLIEVSVDIEGIKASVRIAGPKQS